MTKRPMLCPRCGRLIGGEESSCSWCGAKRPPSWLAGLRSRWGLEADGLIRAIVAVNVAYYLLSILFSARGGGGLLGILGPDNVGLDLLGATGTIPVFQWGRTWTLVSANYLHGGIIHIFFNMMALTRLAPLVIQEYGASRMFVIYTVGGVAGFWVSCLAGVPFTIGASAAVCALIGSLLYFGKSRGGTYGAAVFSEVWGWVIGLVLFGLLVPGINNWGHGGGIVAGGLLGLLLKYNERARETLLHRTLALVCAAVTAGVLGWALITAVMYRFGG